MDNSLLPLKIFLENYAEALDKTLQAAFVREIGGGEDGEMPMTVLPFANAATREIIFNVYPNRFDASGPQYSDFDMELMEFLEEEFALIDEQIADYTDTETKKCDAHQTYFRLTTTNPASLVLILENLIVDHELKCVDDLSENTAQIQFALIREERMASFNKWGLFIPDNGPHSAANDGFTLPFSLQRLYVMALDAGGNITADHFQIDEADEPRQVYRPQEHSQYTALQLTH